MKSAFGILSSAQEYVEDIISASARLLLTRNETDAWYDYEGLKGLLEQEALAFFRRKEISYNTKIIRDTMIRVGALSKKSKNDRTILIPEVRRGIQIRRFFLPSFFKRIKRSIQDMRKNVHEILTCDIDNKDFFEFLRQVSTLDPDDYPLDFLHFEREFWKKGVWEIDNNGQIIQRTQNDWVPISIEEQNQKGLQGIWNVDYEGDVRKRPRYVWEKIQDILEGECS